MCAVQILHRSWGWGYIIYVSPHFGTGPVPALGVQCWHWDVSVPKSSPCQYGAPSAGTGRKKISQFRHWAPSTGTGLPVPELGPSLITRTWHPPHLGTGAQSGTPHFGTSARTGRPILALAGCHWWGTWPIYLRQNENPKFYYSYIAISIIIRPQTGTEISQWRFGDRHVPVPAMGKKSRPVPALGRCRVGPQHIQT